MQAYVNSNISDILLLKFIFFTNAFVLASIDMH